ncbi:iron-containing alcohol dehydrogenase [Pasteurella multocida]|uniref:iron-containing alcohol dehydrogenase n=1 Tax=Pasteurella multocida TaxID=747 RepID=UPI002023E918|nr:iron-containing alcohol dehydrogenase [Pasteurella multocida]MEB3471161.1 iron-containing alcohol dehydrogenase [Pasteurella multocida]URK01993.1 iron-containing alcohol dehydrogenase [Pasteurella multocida]HDR1125460.1 iron-containing alcohol dehydrogenase [Pasteurella multocida]HDR1852486.1 iron-containing alcohol dehydrogenase [Pasteurella multocida]HDR1859027.1 iron-containing alcohol dehydrogenase [Pasteurella multocida]
MLNFTFQLPTLALFGEGQIQAIREHIPQDARILVTTGGGSVKKNGVFAQVENALAGFYWREFSGIEPNPCYETLMKAVEVVKQESLDFILAVGGGSVLDGSKFIASAVKFVGEPWDILAKHHPVQHALPLGCIMTLPATGSEMNGYAVISRQQTGDKLSFASPLVRPVFAVLDPTTTYSLPEKQTANGVVDAFVHTFEQYMTYPQQAKIQDRFAEGVFQTLIEEGPKALANPTDYDARSNIMWAATMALNDILGVGVVQDWASHAIGHELTALYGLDHAQTLAIIVPALMQHQQANKREKLIQFAQRVWHYQGDEEQAIQVSIEKTRQFFEQMGVKTRFSDYAIDDSQFSVILDKLAEHQAYNLGEHQHLDRQAVNEILYAAL